MQYLRGWGSVSPDPPDPPDPPESCIRPWPRCLLHNRGSDSPHAGARRKPCKQQHRGHRVGTTVVTNTRAAAHCVMQVCCVPGWLPTPALQRTVPCRWAVSQEPFLIQSGFTRLLPTRHSPLGSRFLVTRTGQVCARRDASPRRRCSSSETLSLWQVAAAATGNQ